MELLKIAIEALEEVNAKDIRIYETKQNNPFFSYAIVASSAGKKQMDGLTKHIYEKSIEKGFLVRGVEGRGSGSWLLVDLYDVIINLFSAEDRKIYDLDKLWALLPEIDIKTLKL